MKKLPIFRLAPPEHDEARIEQIAVALHGMTPYSANRSAQRLKLSADRTSIEVPSESGGIWMANNAAMWNAAAGIRYV